MPATATNPTGDAIFMAAPTRASYACDPARSRGRVIAETPSRTRNDFQRDRDRIVHSSGFRRLAHKTQVFVPDEGDHYRTRLTHTIEVGQLARALARALGLDDDLAEAIALAHDLGHTPFGHIGEDVLDALMQPWGGFDHNAQALRIVTKLERRYAAFDGLNLTWEALEGLVKHNGPLRRADGRPVARYAGHGLPAALVEYDSAHDLELDRYPSAEAQVAALADDIAYNAHDLDDGLRSGLITVEQLDDVDFLAALRADVDERHPGLETPRLINEIVRRVITRFIEDAISESSRRLQGLADIEAVRRRGAPVVALSSGLAEADRAIKAFLFQNLYRHPTINRVREGAATIVADLFRHFMAEPATMASEWAEGIAALEPGEDARRARLVCDYLAGMTDRYAVAAHRRLFDATPDLR